MTTQLEAQCKDAAYAMVDRYLRNNMGDDDYAEYSQALDVIGGYGVEASTPPVVGDDYAGRAMYAIHASAGGHKPWNELSLVGRLAWNEKATAALAAALAAPDKGSES